MLKTLETQGAQNIYYKTRKICNTKWSRGIKNLWNADFPIIDYQIN